MLRKVFMSALLATTGAAQAQDIHGFFRTALEDGYDTLPNWVMNTQVHDVNFSVALDIYDPDGARPEEGYQGRLLWATAKTKIPCLSDEGGSVEVGLLQPFFNTGFNQSLVAGMPLAVVDQTLLLNGGVTGANATCSYALSNTTKVTMQSYLGTKLARINRDFGMEKGPGYGAAVYGGGASVKHQFSGKSAIDAGYRYTHFGEGDANTSRDVHYGYAVYNTVMNKVEFKLYGEATLGRVNGGQKSVKDLSTTFFVQALVPLHDAWQARFAAGRFNNESAADMFLVFKKGPWAAQMGAGYNVKTKNVRPAVSLVYNF